MLNVAMNCDLCCPDLRDIFISSASGSAGAVLRDGCSLLPAARATSICCCGLAELQDSPSVATFPILGPLPLQNIVVCLSGRVKNEQTQPTAKLKGIKKKKNLFYSLPAFLSPWIRTLAFPIFSFSAPRTCSFASGFTFFESKLDSQLPLHIRFTKLQACVAGGS